MGGGPATSTTPQQPPEKPFWGDAELGGDGVASALRGETEAKGMGSTGGGGWHSGAGGAGGLC